MTIYTDIKINSHLNEISNLKGFRFANNYISDDGRLWNIMKDGNKLIIKNPLRSSSGTLYFIHKTKNINIARLIAAWKISPVGSDILETYYSIKPDFCRVKMLDGRKRNLRFDNIGIVYNTDKKDKSAERHRAIWAIRFKILSGEPICKVASDYGKSESYVSMLMYGFYGLSDKGRELLLNVCALEMSKDVLQHT